MASRMVLDPASPATTTSRDAARPEPATLTPMVGGCWTALLIHTFPGRINLILPWEVGRASVHVRSAVSSTIERIASLSSSLRSGAPGPGKRLCSLNVRAREPHRSSIAQEYRNTQ